MMIQMRLLLLVIALLVNTVAYAHTGLKSSVPEDQAIVTQIPDTVTLEFHAAVHLLKLQLMNEKGEELNLDFQPKSEAAVSFTETLPVLTAGNYTVKWVSMSKDTHKVSGEFSFELKANTQSKPCAKDTSS